MQTITEYHPQAALKSPKGLDMLVESVVKPSPRQHVPRWKRAGLSIHPSLSIKTDLSASKVNINTNTASTLQSQKHTNKQEHTSRSSGIKFTMTTPTKPPGGPRNLGSASKPVPLHPVNQSRDMHRNTGSGTKPAAQQSVSQPREVRGGSGTKMISLPSPKPLRESPRAPKHSLESPGGQPRAKRPAPDLS
jgi:hypothetical protein